MEREPRRVAEGLARALAPAFDPDAARRLAEQLATRIRHPDDPEASVRWSPRGPIRGGRMMLERLDLPTVQWLAEALALPWPEPCERLGRACERLGLPIIGGWDLGDDPHGGRVYKLYANASDASPERAQALADALGVRAPAPPQVVGLNVAAAGIDAKVYLQRSSRAALASSHPLPPLPAALARHDVPATWVLSLDATPQHVAPRAVFVAAHHDTMAATEALVQALTGRSWPELAAHLPFQPGPLRQLGWSVQGSVTVYAKPAGTARPVHALAPFAVFATHDPDAEVGLYVEPSEQTPRAFLRTPRHALSFRVRSGRPDRRALELLGQWAQARIAATEDEDGDEATRCAPCLDDPPAPWRLVPD